TAHQLTERVSLSLESLRVNGVRVEGTDAYRGAVDPHDFRALEQRAEHRALRARVVDEAAPQGTETIDGQRSLLGQTVGRSDGRTGRPSGPHAPEPRATPRIPPLRPTVRRSDALSLPERLDDFFQLDGPTH